MTTLLKNILLACLLLLSASIRAQFYDLGQDPASVKWNVIKTAHFKIIFPAGIEAQAQHIANGFEQVYAPLSADMKIKPVRIPVVLHNRAILSNAEVPWAPKRIEFFMNPGQDDYAQPWVDQLMLHEFRHVVQYSKINQGLTKVLSYIFGQQITAGVIGTFVPLWFVEGDAVCTETAFSKSGRGRTPQFTMKLRAQVLDKGLYNYNKASFGSYKSFVPNRYEFGYHLVATAKKHYTGELWERAMDKAAKLPIMVVPFNHGIKKVSGMGKVKLYKYCFRELDSLWNYQKSQTKLSEATLIKTRKNKLYTSYNFSKFSGNGSYISVRSGLNDVDRFIRIDSNGREHTLVTPGSYAGTSFSVAANKITWAETSHDPRWENRTYSVIKIYDQKKHRIRQLSHRSRYFVPALDKQGKKIICVEQSIANQSALLVLDAEKGSVLKRFEADSADFIMTPGWSETGNEIVYIALNRNGKRICLLDSTGISRDLTDAGFMEISQPVMHDKHVFFVGAYSGINNIYALELSTKKIFQVTSSLYGASEPALSDDGKELIYSDYTADGYKPAKAVINPAQWVPVENVADYSDKLYQSLNTPQTQIIDFYKDEKITYPVKRYSKLLNLFNIHSWGPISIDADNTTVKPGFEILSQNLLSTMVISAGYEHEWNETQSKIYAKLSYRGLYPQLDMEFSYHFLRSDTITWEVFAWQAGIKIPFKFTKGKYYIFLQPQINFHFYDLIPKKNYQPTDYSGYYQAMEYGFYGYNVLKTSLRDINPRWGQSLEFTYRHTPFSGSRLGDIMSLQGLLLFPGIGRHHSLSIYGGYQQKNGKDYLFNDIISLPQGYDSSGYNRILTLKGTYQMPLFYPDWSIGSLIYIKRFRASFYYDYAIASDKNDNRYTFSSAGIALIADFHALRFLAPLSMGIRTTYRFDNGAVLPEFVYSVNIDELRFRRGFSRTGN